MYFSVQSLNQWELINRTGWEDDGKKTEIILFPGGSCSHHEPLCVYYMMRVKETQTKIHKETLQQRQGSASRRMGLCSIHIHSGLFHALTWILYFPVSILKTNMGKTHNLCFSAPTDIRIWTEKQCRENKLTVKGSRKMVLLEPYTNVIIQIFIHCQSTREGQVDDNLATARWKKWWNF